MKTILKIFLVLVILVLQLVPGIIFAAGMPELTDASLKIQLHGKNVIFIAIFLLACVQVVVWWMWRFVRRIS